MEESDEFRVTRHTGSIVTKETAIVLYSSLDEMAAWCFYRSFRTLPGMSLAFWRPDGTLVAFKIGP